MTTSVGDFLEVKQNLTEAGFESEMAEVTMKASTTTELDVDDAGKMMRLQDALEDLDDVQNVYSNADISDEVLAEL